MKKNIEVNGIDIELNIFRTDWEEVKVYFHYRFQLCEKEFHCDADNDTLNPYELLDYNELYEFVDMSISDIKHDRYTCDFDKFMNKESIKA